MKTLTTKTRARMALVIPTIIAAGLLTVGTVSADVDRYGKDKRDCGERQYKKMEHLAEKLDMTNEQEAQLEQILKSAKEERKANKTNRRRMHLEMMSINPDDPDYRASVEQHAETAAEHMKANILKNAEVRQQVYAILTDEQKQKMQRMKEKRMKKMEKRHGKMRSDNNS